MGEPELWEIRVRRYLCLDCGACMTVLPAGLARAYRYSLAAIAMALALWSLWRLPAARVRERVSPFRQVGPSEPTRWRSLRRWVWRAAKLFSLAAEPTVVAATREVAERVAHLVLARGPEGMAELERLFAGAQVR
jgi:ferredoxin